MTVSDIIQLTDLLAWPSAVVILAIWFRKPITDLMGRIKRISPSGGIETVSLPSQKSPTEGKPSAEELMRTFDSVILREQEENIKKDLEKYSFSDQHEKEQILIRHLASTQLALLFEGIDKLIWGSQIYILEKLNSTADGATKKELKLYYDGAAASSPEVFSTYSFDSYLNFLSSSNLIIQQDGRYRITNLGRDFLKHLAATGRTGVRPY